MVFNVPFSITSPVTSRSPPATEESVTVEPDLISIFLQTSLLVVLPIVIVPLLMISLPIVTSAFNVPVVKVAPEFTVRSRAMARAVELVFNTEKVPLAMVTLFG